MASSSSTNAPVELAGSLTPKQLVELGADVTATISIGSSCLASVSASRKVLDKAIKKKVVAGVNGGFGDGPLEERPLGKKVVIKEQTAMVVSAIPSLDGDDAAGKVMDVTMARMMMVGKIASLLNAGAGVRKPTLESLVGMFNAGLVPAIPVDGSEVAKAAAMVGPLVGAGYLVDGDTGAVVPASEEVLEAAGVAKAKLMAGEGKALLAGTVCATVQAAVAAVALSEVASQGAVVSMVSWSSLGGSIAPYEEAVHSAKPHMGQRRVSDTLRTFGLPEVWYSAGYKAAVEEAGRCVDAAGGPAVAALASIPQVYGPVADTTKAAMRTLGTELNGCGASPMVSVDGAVVAVNANDDATYVNSVAAALVAVGIPLVCNIAARVALVAPSSDAAAAAAALEGAATALVCAGSGAEAPSTAAMVAALAKDAVALEFATAGQAVAARGAALAEPLACVVGLLGDKASVETAAAALESSAVASVAEPFLMRGPGPDPSGKGKGGKASKGRRKPKIAKGTRDFGPLDMSVRREVFQEIESVYRSHGAVSIDTPTFELRETLLGRYGEDTKLIYDLADQGGEDLSLRYDLTVPFARYVAQAGISKIKRYHIGRVFRRDNPAIARGRFREFYQCDFDIAGGGYVPMVADAECVIILAEILTRLDIGEYVIKINHRKLLDGIFSVCGVPEVKFRTTCSSVDKLDKMPWAEVAAELVDIKGLSPEVVSALEKYVMMGDETASFEPTLEALEACEELVANPLAAEALADMRKFAGIVAGCGIDSRISFCTSLARGLDYYTGIILEAILMDSTTSLGSIAGGGRYDDLIGMFGSRPVPSVGFSVGIERVFALVKARKEAEGSARETATLAQVVGLGSVTPGDRMRLAKLLWDAGVPAEITYAKRTNFKVQLEHVVNSKIPLMIILGDEELERGTVQVKMIAESGGEEKQVEVARDELAGFVTTWLADAGYEKLL